MDHSGAGVSPPNAEPDLTDAVRRLARTSAVVIGDAMLDRYIYGTVERVSREAPVPVLSVHRELCVPGGAGNVMRNLVALGTAVAFVSVVGDDQAGSDLTGLIGGQPGVEPWLLVQGSRITTQKTRFVAQGQQMLRADREDTSPIHPKLAERMLRIVRDAMAATSISVLSDYGNGVLAGDVPAQLIAAAHAAGRKVVVDLRGVDYSRYFGADVVVPSRRDLARVTAMAVNGDAAIEAAAEKLRQDNGFGAVLVTRAEDGMTLVSEEGAWHFRAEAAEVFDVAGAGDTAVAALAAALASGQDLPVAARLANIAAGVVVGKIGIAVARPSDLLAAITPQGGSRRKIVGREVAGERVERWRRTGLRTGLARGYFDPLRPGHVFMLEQARASCERLVVALASDASLSRRGDEAGPGLPASERARRLAELPSVDLVVIEEDERPDELLTELRPDVLVAGGGRTRMPGADMVQNWGGKVVLTERLPEIAE
jgi:D-beta-D-heptose 7-phosphate kinase/D-beta-D-heptose 1-phosphate adenosyltransferase